MFVNSKYIQAHKVDVYIQKLCISLYTSTLHHAGKMGLSCIILPELVRIGFVRGVFKVVCGPRAWHKLMNLYPLVEIS